MKKIASLLLAAAMLFVTAACEPEVEEPEPPEEQTVTEQPAFKVGVVYCGDPALDSECAAHERGIEAMQLSLGLDDGQIIRKTDVPADTASVGAALEECAAEGCGIIFAADPSCEAAMAAAAEAHPEIVFSCSGINGGNGKNFNGYYGRFYQVQYLCGVAAGMRTASGAVGYVAGKAAPSALRGIDAFAMGVERANPAAVVYVKYVSAPYGGDMVSPERQAALALLDMGCDVIAQDVNSVEPQLAAEERGAFSCGYNAVGGEDAPSTRLTAPLWNWGVYYTMTTKAVMENTWVCESYYGGMADGLVELLPLSKSCAEGTSAAVEAAKDEILAGRDVFSGEIIDNFGNVICPAEASLDDKTVAAGLNWYYRNVRVTE